VIYHTAGSPETRLTVDATRTKRLQNSAMMINLSLVSGRESEHGDVDCTQSSSHRQQQRLTLRRLCP